MNKKYEMDMYHGPLMKQMIQFSIPLILTGILQLLFNAVDIVVVGRFTGSTALAAVGSTTFLINLFTNLFIGISLGVNVLVARYYASGQEDAVSDIVHTAIATALISGIAMTILGILTSRPALILMDTPDDVLDQAVLYIRIYYLGMIFFMLYNYGAAVLKGIGDTRRPLYYLMFAGTLNVVCNLILVIVFRMGVAGVAIATIFSQCISSLLVMRCLMKTDGCYRFLPSRLCLKWKYMKAIFVIGVPAGIQSTIINLSNALLQTSVNSFGSLATAGYTAANNMLGFMYFAVNAVSQCCMSFTSQNMGAGKKKRMDLVCRNGLILEIILSLFMGCCFYFFGPELLGIYTTDDNVIKNGMEILSITTLPYFLCGIMDMIPGCMRGMGHAFVPMVLSIIGTVGIRLVWIFGAFPQHRSLFFLFISYPLSWLITIVMQVVCYYFVRKKVYLQMRTAS